MIRSKYCVRPLAVFLTGLIAATSTDAPAQEKNPSDPSAPSGTVPPSAGQAPAAKAGTVPATSDAEAFEQIEIFTRVLEIVRQNYVDPDKVTYEKLINSALTGMLADRFGMNWMVIVPQDQPGAPKK